MAARFPEDHPQADNASLPAAAEAAELLALAEELRGVHTNPAVSVGFSERVLAGMTRTTGLRAVLRRSRLAQAAATLFVVSISVAPLLALVQILPWLRETRLVIQVEQLLLPPRVETKEDPLPPLAQPKDPAALDPAWVESVSRQNRMARAAASWSMAGTQGPGLTGMEPSVWETASVEDLWQEFLRRCAQGGSGPFPAALLARVEVLGLVGGAEERRRLAPWLWVLHGDAVPAAAADLSQVWSNAPWIAE